MSQLRSIHTLLAWELSFEETEQVSGVTPLPICSDGAKSSTIQIVKIFISKMGRISRDLTFTFIICFLGTDSLAAVTAYQDNSSIHILTSFATDNEQPSKEIVVSGSQSEKSHWNETESRHFILLCDCSKSDTVEVSRNLERLFALLSRLYRHGDTSDNAERVRMIILGPSAAIHVNSLDNGRGAEGPYLPIFDKRFYDPRDAGDLIVVSRSENLIALNTPRRFKSDCDAIQGMEDGGLCGSIPFHSPIAISWKQLSYSSFAQHFFLTYLTGVYPRWYMD